MSLEEAFKWSDKLVREFPDKATELLATGLGDDPDKLRTAVKIERLKQPKKDTHDPQSESPKIASERTQSRHSASSLPSPVTLGRSSQARDVQAPPSDISTSSERSNAGKIVQIFNVHCKPERLTYVLTSNPFSFIARDAVQHRLDLYHEVCNCQDARGHTGVEYMGGKHGSIIVSSVVSLTWLRSGNRTHKTDFYVVDDLDEADVLLSEGCLTAHFDKQAPARPGVALNYDLSASQDDPGPSYHRSSETSSAKLSHGKAESVRSSSTKAGAAKTSSSKTSYSRTEPHSAANSKASKSKSDTTRTAIFSGRQHQMSSPSRQTSRSGKTNTSDRLGELRMTRESSTESQIPQMTGSAGSASVRSWMNRNEMSEPADVFEVKHVWAGDSLRQDLDLTVSYEVFYNILESTWMENYSRQIDRTANSVVFRLKAEGVKDRNSIIKLDEKSLEKHWTATARDLRKDLQESDSELHVIIKGG